VRDLALTAESKDKLRDIDTGLLYTEWKFENGIDRVTSAANPRNLERVPKGAEFSFAIVYDVEDRNSLSEDLKNLQLAIQLLHDDSLGGHGSRGYGQVRLKFSHIEARKLDFYVGDASARHSVDRIDHIAELVSFFD
jgi:CRISPR-associated protein Csm3